jgi:hypothetical protein
MDRQRSFCHWWRDGRTANAATPIIQLAVPPALSCEQIILQVARECKLIFGERQNTFDTNMEKRRCKTLYIVVLRGVFMQYAQSDGENLMETAEEQSPTHNTSWKARHTPS